MPRVLAVLFGFAVLAAAPPTAASAGPPDPPIDATVYALLADNTLVALDPTTLAVLAKVPIEVPGGELVSSIDFRSSSQDLFGVGDAGGVYRIDPNTGVATPVGGSPIAGLASSGVHLDIDPVIDRLRVVTTAGQDVLVHPDTGVVEWVCASCSEAALAASLRVATSVTGVQYGIDHANDTLVTIPPGPAGGSLGVDAAADFEFDIGDATNKGYLVAVPTTSDGSWLYTVDLGTGMGIAIDPASGGGNMIDIAIRP